MSLMSLTAVELGKKIKAKEVTVTEAVTAALDAIEAKEKRVNSFVTVDREGALKRAEEVQKMIDDDKPIEVNCHFCNSHYTFTVEELKQMLEAVRR